MHFIIRFYLEYFSIRKSSNFILFIRVEGCLFIYRKKSGILSCGDPFSSTLFLAKLKFLSKYAQYLFYITDKAQQLVDIGLPRETKLTKEDMHTK